MFKRMSITIPEETYTLLQEEVKKGEQSKFITEAIKYRIVAQKVALPYGIDPFVAAREVRKGLPNYTDEDIIDLINKGRDE